MRSGSDRAMALTVKSRRDRSRFDGVGEDHLRLAAVRVVGLRPVGGDLHPAAAQAQRRSSRNAGPGPTPRRPSRSTSASMSSGRASVVKSRSAFSSRRPRTASRTTPPTRYRRNPASLNRPARSLVSSSKGRNRSGITTDQTTGLFAPALGVCGPPPPARALSGIAGRTGRRGAGRRAQGRPGRDLVWT